MDSRPRPLKWVIFGQLKRITHTTAKAQLHDLLIEPLEGSKGVYAHRQNLMQRVMRMRELEARDHLERLRAAICQAPEASRARERNS